jgi:hypothetical protein
MGWTIGLVAAVVVVVLWFLVRSPHYARIFSDDHVVEFARPVADLKPAVLANIDDEDAGQFSILLPGDPRTMRTSAGLFAMYTIGKRGGRYQHHFSVRDTEGYTAAAVGTTFGVLAPMVFGIDPTILHIERSENAVYHVEYELDEARQRAFAERPPLAVTKESARALQNEAMKVRDRLGFEHVATGVRFIR